MEKLLATLFILTLLLSAGSVITFADTTDTGIDNPFARPELTEDEKKEMRYDKMVELLDTYLNERSEEWQAGYAEHDLIHEELETIKLEIGDGIKPYVEEQRLAIQSEIQSLKAQIEAGEITRLEAFELFEDFKAPLDEIKAEIEGLKNEFEALQVLGDEIKSAQEVARQALMEALEAESSDIEPLLDALVDIHFEHLEYDQEKLALQNKRLLLVESLTE